MEKYKATMVANDIRDEDHAGDSTVVIIGKPRLMGVIMQINPWN